MSRGLNDYPNHWFGGREEEGKLPPFSFWLTSENSFKTLGLFLHFPIIKKENALKNRNGLIFKQIKYVLI